jgi:hypothetical protein
MKKLFLFLIILLLIIVLVPVFFVNDIIKTAVKELGPEVLGVSVTLDDVDISILDGKGSILGITIGNPSGFSEEYSIKVEKVYFAADINSLFSETILINNISITKPDIIYEFNGSESNLSALAMHSKKEAREEKLEDQQEKETSEKSELIIEHLIIKDGKIKSSIAGAGATLDLPTIEMKDLGKEDGTDVEEVVAKVMATIVGTVSQLDLSSLKGIAEGAGEKALENFKDLGKGVKGLFD